MQCINTYQIWTIENGVNHIFCPWNDGFRQKNIQDPPVSYTIRTPLHSLKLGIIHYNWG